MTDYPKTPGEFLLYLEAAGVADLWDVSTDPADARDQCGTVRRTFRYRPFGEAQCGIVAEFGALFIVCGDTDFLLTDLYRPDRLRDAIGANRWASPDATAFVDVLEQLFPREPAHLSEIAS